MTRTKVSKAPLLLGGAAVLAVLAFMATAGGEDQELPQNTSVHCKGDAAEVEFGADLRTSRPIRVRYWTTGTPVIAHDIKADSWRTVDPALPCGTTAHLTVIPADGWGGDTHCWIEVNGRGAVEQRTRLRAECSVSVTLIAS